MTIPAERLVRQGTQAGWAQPASLALPRAIEDRASRSATWITTGQASSLILVSEGSAKDVRHDRSARLLEKEGKSGRNIEVRRCLRYC